MGININEILTKETLLLVADAKELSIKEFLKIAKQEQIRQEDWSLFWSLISQYNCHEL
jgi:hypothetical protein